MTILYMILFCMYVPLSDADKPVKSLRYGTRELYNFGTVHYITLQCNTV